MAIVAAVALIAPINSNAISASASTKAFKSCSDLQKKYKFGVSISKAFKNKGSGPIETPWADRSLYLKNSKLDTDRDGVACQVGKRPTQVDNSAAEVQPLDTCKLRETQNIAGAGAKGFPARQNVSSVGNVKIAILPVDFSDAPGDGNPVNLFTDDVKKIQEWGKFYSRGKLSYEIEFGAKSWIRAPKGAEWYTCMDCQKGARSERQPQQQAIQQLVDAADKLYNFADVKIIYFVFPYEAEKEFGTALYGWNYRLTTADGPIEASVYGEMGGGLGNRTDRSKIWDHAVHEFLHFQGFIGHGPQDGSSYYISTHQWGSSKSVTAWEGFLNGWFDESEVICLDKSKLTKDIIVRLDSIDVFGKHKEALMIRIDDEQLIVVERRAKGPFSDFCTICGATSDEGFTAYRVNVNAPHYRNYRNYSEPAGESKNFWGYLREMGKPLIKTTVEFAGVRLSRVSETLIKVSLEKYSNVLPPR